MVAIYFLRIVCLKDECNFLAKYADLCKYFTFPKQNILFGVLVVGWLATKNWGLKSVQWTHVKWVVPKSLKSRPNMQICFSFFSLFRMYQVGFLYKSIPSLSLISLGINFVSSCNYFSHLAIFHFYGYCIVKFPFFKYLVTCFYDVVQYCVEMQICLIGELCTTFINFFML